MLISLIMSIFKIPVNLFFRNSNMKIWLFLFLSWILDVLFVQVELKNQEEWSANIRSIVQSHSIKEPCRFLCRVDCVFTIEGYCWFCHDRDHKIITMPTIDFNLDYQNARFENNSLLRRGIWRSEVDWSKQFLSAISLDISKLKSF